jgi:hypothetical protein
MAISEVNLLSCSEPHALHLTWPVFCREAELSRSHIAVVGGASRILRLKPPLSPFCGGNSNYSRKLSPLTFDNSNKCARRTSLGRVATVSEDTEPQGLAASLHFLACGGSGISAFRVSTSFDSPSWLVRTASNPVAGDTSFSKSTDEVLTPTIFTWGSLPRRSDTVTRLSCSGILRWRSIRSQRASIALGIADTSSSTASHTL